jgi:outer membrane protein assembly factor BamE (lipoprotein component of BamABCDE complex)
MGRETKVRVKIGLIAMLCLLVAACARLYSTHGYVPTDEDLAQIVTGKTTSEEVVTLIGPPTVDELIAGGATYYVKSRFESYTYHEAKEIDREVVAISFDNGGRVSNVERFGLEKGQIVQISTRITGTGFDKVSTLRRIFGALGNFSAAQALGGGAPN